MISAVLTLRHFLRHLVLDKTVFIPGKLTLCMLGDLSTFFCCQLLLQINFFFFKFVQKYMYMYHRSVLIKFEILLQSKQFAKVISRRN